MRVELRVVIASIQTLPSTMRLNPTHVGEAEPWGARKVDAHRRHDRTQLTTGDARDLRPRAELRSCTVRWDTGDYVRPIEGSEDG